MSEMGEATAPVDQGQLPEMAAGGLRESSETVARGCYNSRTTIEAPGVSTPEPNGNEASIAGGTDGESSGKTSHEARSGPDNGEASSMDVAMNLPGGELSGVKEGDTGSSSEPMNDHDARQSDLEPWQSGSRSPDGGEGESNARSTEDPLVAHWDPQDKEWDKEMEDKIEKMNRRMKFGSNYMLPTDFSKHFDIRTDQGPKQPLESSLARARRRLDEMKAWRKKVEEQSPMVYNRKVGKSHQ